MHNYMYVAGDIGEGYFLVAGSQIIASTSILVGGFKFDV